MATSLITLDGYSLPALSGGSFSFISHAHFDHLAIGKEKKVIASEETIALIRARGRQVEINNGVKGVELLDSGHILGSKQIFIEDYENGYSLLYTGDYQLQEPIIGKPIQAKQADVLLIDSTYPFEQVKFEDKKEVAEAIKLFVKQKIEKGSIIFQAYSLGRAQELIKILNEIGIAPSVDKQIEVINKVYEQFGVKLYYLPWKAGHEKEGNFVGVFSRGFAKEIAKSLSSQQRRYFMAVATGWAKIFRFNVDVQFALSDHADFSQAIEYINQVSPKSIITMGKSAKEFAMLLSKKGYNARAYFEVEHSLISGLWQSIFSLALIK